MMEGTAMGTLKDPTAEEPAEVPATREHVDALPVTTAYRRANQIAGIAFALLGAGLTFGGLSLGLTVRGVPGPGLFPTIIGSLLLLLGVVLFCIALAGKLDRSEDASVPDSLGVRRILITLLSSAIFIWAVLWIGYLIAMTLYVFVLLSFVGARRRTNSALIALVFGVGSFVAFKYGLGLPLPSAALPFLRGIGL
ncbi:tripartite tricarboxylate transporter TctB family protein [Arthrobacter nitrophenolicus]|uniref:Tripartite tricarboxylate transporter TctB family protein n=1 Tax=Arthrobacter nitrophenolicus TaxID=683150 RepID=A0A4R5Y992_9MICC|nr:tripartite tricarboxylate transporter TctB family protein [Arthrobacter nitrophenolicus]TDL39692.1 tripartite tricarboxylate transporter TctB family protein [Arthrobacter nitrophenolicus]